jgi:Putative flagellar system-associated repeat
MYKYYNMKNQIFLILTLLLISLRAVSQPAETIYQGTLIKNGYLNNIGLTEDGPFPIGFDFSFFGNSYSEFYVTVNGQIMFTDPEGYYSTEASIPDIALPNNYIAAFWDDLVIDGSGRILYKTIGLAPNRKLIIQFKNMGFYPFPVFFGTFSVILYETSNVIQTQYRLIVDNSSTKAQGESATIGIENSDGTIGVEYAYHNPAAISSEQAISYTAPGPAYTNYTVNSNALYDGVYLTTNITLPEPGISNLTSPPQDAVIGADYTFQWGEASNATNYSLKISTNSDLSGSTSYDAGSNLSYDINGLTLDETYYWGVFASNATGLTWCEIKRFSTSSIPPLVPVPQTVWVEQNQDITIKLYYTGGNASSKAAIIDLIPTQGQLYQYNAGVRGNLISASPTTVSDADMNVIYAATGGTGNGVGNFNFKINDSDGDSPAGTVSINVSPPGVPSVLNFSKNQNVEIEFDKIMADPAGKESQFEVTSNGTPVTITSANLKTGDPYTIILNLGTALTGSETVEVSYTQGDVMSATGGFLFSFTGQAVSLTAQTISFTQDLAKKISDSPFVLISNASSGLGMTYSSSNLAVVTIVNSVATFISTGSSDITARQAGNGTYAPVKFIKTLTVEKGDQTITFNALPTKTVGDADFSPGATASSGLPITYVSYNTAVATIVSGNIHIVAAGSAVINASQAGNTLWNAATSVSQTLNIQGAVTDKTLFLTSVLLEGLYSSSGNMRQAWNESGPQWPAGVADHITVELHSTTSYSTIVYTATDIPLSTVGTTSVTIPSIYDGTYYITIKHRNSIETTTVIPVSFSVSTINQSFGLTANVYGSNLKKSPDAYYLIYGGDVNQNGSVDTGDYAPVVNDVSNYVQGYLATDINGNGSVDTGDYSILVNNTSQYIHTHHP